MKAEAALNAVRKFPVGSLQSLTGNAPFIVLAPHPDDESLGMGGTIAAAAKAGLHIEIVVTTDGSGSHPNSRLYPRADLIALRKAELAAAIAALGLPNGRLTFLGFQDAAMPSAGPDFDDAVARICALAETIEAKSLFTTWGHDPHCDHEATAILAGAVQARMPDLKLWFFPVWGWHLDPGSDIECAVRDGLRVDVTDFVAIKRQAIDAHASQMTHLVSDDPDGFRFDDKMLAPFLSSYEFFIRGPS